MYHELLRVLGEQDKHGLWTVRTLVDKVEGVFEAQGFRAAAAKDHIRQILVLQLDGLEDAVMVSAFLRELRRNDYAARITLVVRSECENIVSLSPYVNQVETLETEKLQQYDNLDKFRYLADFACKALWKNKYDLCIVPRFDYDRSFAGLLGLFSGARQRLGFSENVTTWKQRLNKGCNGFYTQVLPGEGLLHEVERSLSIIRTMGGKVASNVLEVWTGAEDEEWAAEVLKEATSPIAAFSLGTGKSNHCWPLDRYGEIAAWLSKTHGMTILVLGGADDIMSGKYLEDKLPKKVLNYAGRATSRQMAAMLRRCRIYIGGDSVVMHLAAGVKLPVAEISSCTANAMADGHFSSPRRFGPWGVPSRVLQPVEVDVTCARGCLAQEPHCILKISSVQVQQAVAEVLTLPKPEEFELQTPAVPTGLETWPNVLRKFAMDQETLKKSDPSAAMVAADEFFIEKMARIRPHQAMAILPALAEQWMLHRKLPHRFGSIPPAEQQRFLVISSRLRSWLRHLLLSQDVSVFGSLSERQQRQWESLWRLLFINAFSPFALRRDQTPSQHEGRRIQDYLVQSLYDQPTNEGARIDVQSLLASDAPAYLKAIFCAWLVETPYFGVVEKDRQRVCQYSTLICNALTRSVSWLSLGIFTAILQVMMAAFWRISYAGGDSTRELSLLGDFVTYHMNRFFPQEKQGRRQITDDDSPIKIGYISRNFCKQAVGFYMVNRIVHHDSKQFDVHTFVTGDRDDELTEVFRKHSGRFTRHAQMTDLPGIIRTIKESRLDILVYADLGMDPFSLMLAGLRLAPVQCVLVGHGVTSGMPHIDYYISGDFEPEEAAHYYREKLVRLPKLGAAQYPPFMPENFPTRKDYKIPEDAIVYVSCANGIKIHPDQDRLFIEILKQVPNAWLVLKPFQTPDVVDLRFWERILEPARAAGVSNRIVVVSPFRQSRDVLGLLRFSDIQLDTYPYGGWTTNMEAMYMGLPVVTQEGKMARSRWGASMLRALGIGAGIARNEREYVKWAVKLGIDHKLRERVRSVIREKAVTTFFDGASAQGAYEKVLLDCNRANREGMRK